MITESSLKKGKSIEYYLISKLLENDFSVYTPVVDDEGIDIIVKNKEGGFVEIQVKSRVIKDERDCFTIKNFKPKENFFIVCHNITHKEFFVMPSSNFYDKSQLKIRKDRGEAREIPYYIIRRYRSYRNNEGLELIQRALINPHNKISGKGKVDVNQAIEILKGLGR
jgi:hypothetical protein